MTTPVCLLIKHFDLDNIHQYSNIDISKYHCCVDVCKKIATYDYNKLCAFIDMFDDITKKETKFPQNSTLNLIEIIYLSLYNGPGDCKLNYNDKLKIECKIIEKCGLDKWFKCNQQIMCKSNCWDGFCDCICCYSGKCHCINDNCEYCHDYKHERKIYIKKYYNVINALFRLTNSKNIGIDNINDKLLMAIKTILLMTKLKPIILPKYLILHKILYYLL